VAPTDPRVIARYVLWNSTGTIIQHIQRAYRPEQIAAVDNRGIDFTVDPNLHPPDPPHKGNWNNLVAQVLADLIARFGLTGGSDLEHYLRHEARHVR
jgi:hypothetical protein